MAKGTIGAIPIVGPLFAEVIGAVIPDQRIDRLSRLMAEIEKQTSGVPSVTLNARFTDPEFVDLLEDGMHQAARALDPVRIEQIAALLRNSIADEELNRLQDKRLLAILGELNEAEVVILTSYLRKNTGDTEFMERHRAVLTRPAEYLGDPNPDLDARALFDEYKSHLARVGLLRVRFKRPKKGELPEFDEKTGAMKATGYELTQLGMLLLRRIDLAGETDR